MRQMRRALLILLAVTLLAPAPSVAASSSVLPRGFIGISPQGDTEGSDYELMQLAGIESVRLPMPWASVEPDIANLEDPNWSAFDVQVARAAQHGPPFLLLKPRNQ